MIVRNSDNVVIYDDTWALTANGATRNGVWDRATTTANATQIDGETLPTYWTGGAYSWTAQGGFVVVDQSLVDAAKKAAVPKTITARQIRLVLNANGLLSAADSAAQAAGGDIAIDWEYATEFDRDNANLNAMAATLGLSQAEVDAMFIAGADL